MAKKRTTIRVDEKVLDRVRKSGVRNVSEYTQNLWIEDLKRQKEISKKEETALDRIDKKLEELDQKWEDLVKRKPKRY